VINKKREKENRGKMKDGEAHLLESAKRNGEKRRYHETSE